jgi:hypothetical protein
MPRIVGAQQQISKWEGRARHLRIVITSLLGFTVLLAMQFPGHAAQSENQERRMAAKCTAQLRKCNSHCSLVYESRRARQVCRGRCEDAFYVCKAQPN